MLKVENLTVRYHQRSVLYSINLQQTAGSVLGIIGPNGAGKTTLIRAISGVLPLLSGQIQVDGQDITHLPAQARACLMAVVPQARQLPPAFTGWETVLLGRTAHLNWLGQTSAHDEAIARQAMQRTATLELAERRVGELSGGEQQRLLLARALAQAAPLLLLDEPTTHLDLQHQVSILELLRKLAHEDGLTVLLALHDLNLVSQYTDQVALLVDGQVIKFGTPLEVLTPQTLSEAYHLPLEIIGATHTGSPVIMPVIR